MYPKQPIIPANVPTVYSTSLKLKIQLDFNKSSLDHTNGLVDT